MAEGFLYISADDEYLKEAEESAKRVKEVMPEYPICVITDSDKVDPVFDEVIDLPEPDYGFGDKVGMFQQTSFEKTIFLDTDTYLTEPIPELFETLSRFDLCAIHANGRNYYHRDLDVPATVPEYNTGVVAYTDSQGAHSFLDKWDQFYQKHRQEGVAADQPSFRQAVWESDINIGTIPPEYNCKLSAPGFLNGTAKVVHGHRHDPRESVAEKLNSTEKWRVHAPIAEDLGVYCPETASVLETFLYSLATNGPLKTARVIKRKLLSS